MKICVCVKHIPDPTMSMVVDPQTKRLVRDRGQSILDPSDEFSVETALKLVEEHGGESVAITMGPDGAEDALRRAMAMGIDRSILINDDALAGSDVLSTARTLAAVLAGEQPDLVICATESTDAYTGMVPGALAELLGLPLVSFARSVTVDGATISAQQDTERGYRTVQSPLPALLTVTASIAEPRYPSFKGMMQAKKKPLARLDASSLGLDPQSVGEAGARERVLSINQVHQEKQGRTVVDDGTGSSVEEIVAFLKSIQVV
ncbi:MAG TPA: electron transfer flavoprotein subunit beta/FixA family protein [Nitrolancea sp.]|nr:electron transfer flavoprotein subunit beta/FixA family protein [Nitrolancea sp.]